ncbi:MAG: hypothetical protein ACRECV_02060 [Xanthobacteraceae bacterium]
MLAIETITASVWKQRTRRAERAVAVDDPEPEPRHRGLSPRNAEEETIQDYALELLQHVPPIPHDQIISMVHKRFPTVLTAGPHRGEPTRLDRKCLYDIRDAARQLGATFPDRPRSLNRIMARLAATEATDQFSRRCAHCGEPFPATGSRLYCGPDCADAAHRDQQDARNRRNARNSAAAGSLGG